MCLLRTVKVPHYGPKGIYLRPLLDSSAEGCLGWVRVMVFSNIKLHVRCIRGALPALCVPVVKLKTTPGPPYDLPQSFTNAGSNDRDGCMPLGPYPDCACGLSFQLYRSDLPYARRRCCSSSDRFRHCGTAVLNAPLSVLLIIWRPRWAVAPSYEPRC